MSSRPSARRNPLPGTLWLDYTELHPGPAHTVVGSIKVLPQLFSPQLGNRRDILTYLPPSYASGEKRYPVIYMHDGQNLFDQATSFSGVWHAGAALEEVSRRGAEAIVVGIPNMGQQRLNEYSPFEDAEHGGGGRGDGYLDFVVRTLKPIIDRDFRTLPGRRNTGIVGSSMGGLISLYAFFCRPTTFGLAGVMSPALWFAHGAIFNYVAEAPFNPGRIYLDVGTREGRAELKDVRRLRDLLVEKGYRPPDDLLLVVERGAGHNEAAWGRRLRRELRFLLGGVGHSEGQHGQRM